MDLQLDSDDDEPTDTPGFCVFKVHHAASAAAATLPPGCTQQEALWAVFQQLPQHITEGYETMHDVADGLYASSLQILILQIKSFFSQLARQRVVNPVGTAAYLLQIRVNKRYLVAAAMQGAARREATGAMQR